MPAFRCHVPASDPSVGADLLIVPVGAPPGDLVRRLGRLGRGVAESAGRALDLGDFAPESGSCLLLHSRGFERFPRLLLVGLGEERERTAASVRAAFRTAARQAIFERIDSAAVDCGGALGSGGELARNVAAALDGLLEGGYRWTAATEAAPSGPGSFVFLGGGTRSRPRIEDGIRAGRAVGEAVCEARDLANAPANRMGPAELAERARDIARRSGLAVRVLAGRALARERCGAIRAVGAGSTRDPRLIVLEHRGAGTGAPVALVGKGLVFDTGGLNIKPGASMAEMKYDKCGACVVLGAMRAIAELGLPLDVVAVIPAVENSISGEAYRPGDVIASRSGRTIEVANTDAEGRLVLADAIDYAIERHGPQALVDVATLTGAAYHALGDHACAVLGTDESLVRRVVAAGERAGERAWQLPLWDEYLEDVRTPNADVRNTGSHGAGTIAGAAFLRGFVGEVPWAHLDIANVSRDRRRPKRGATGFGVRLLVELLRSWPARRRRARARPARGGRRR